MSAFIRSLSSRASAIFTTFRSNTPSTVPYPRPSPLPLPSPSLPPRPGSPSSPDIIPQDITNTLMTVRGLHSGNSGKTPYAFIENFSI